MTMVRAVRLHGIPNDTRVDLIPGPELTPQGVIVRLAAATVCANDWKTAMRGSGRAELPCYLGHELAGVVEAVGDRIKEYAPGDRVCIRFASAIYCGHCYYCIRGEHNLCEDWQYFNHPAGWVERMYFDERLDERLLHIDEGVSLEAAALVEPLACSLAGIEMARIPYGEEVVILGAGPMGLFCLQLALLAGAADAIVVDTVPSRLEIAKVLGATCLVDFKATDSIAAVKDVTHGRGAASVIECSGSLAGAEQSIQMVRSRGTVVWFAGFPRPSDLHIDANTIHYKGIRLTGTSGSTNRHTHRILAYLRSRRLKVEPIISHRLGFADARQALELAANQRDALKIVLRP